MTPHRSKFASNGGELSCDAVSQRGKPTQHPASAIYLNCKHSTPLAQRINASMPKEAPHLKHTATHNVSTASTSPANATIPVSGL
ncbi:hypothetical protein N7535_003724 [Penicillium sp. DV-2018c]|nr:hypothetical protein N7461_000575 [Penicillium sp. DV-2018c]KAJ5576798.1 hypothetical protein N7535_003724 [Penicillium sp. DV-2018c]